MESPVVGVRVLATAKDTQQEVEVREGVFPSFPSFSLDPCQVPSPNRRGGSDGLNKAKVKKGAPEEEGEVSLQCLSILSLFI